MLRDSVRKFSAFFLVAVLWSGAIAFYPASVAAQTTPAKKQDKEDKKDKKDKKTEASTAQTQTQTSNPNGPLSPKDDPTMIGKRKINGGTGDKFFGWLGGSKEKEIAIGRQLATEVEQQAKLVEDPIVTEYINRVGQNVVLNSDAKVPFTIKVIDSDEVNAFALPGGFFYVNKGLILAADNEAELAGVMAHEIGHVAARHAMENQGKLQALNYGMLAGIIFGGGIASTVLQNAGGLTQALAFFKFSRGAEGEADNLGVQYLYAAGYDPTAMSTMFEKLSSKNKKKPGTLSKLFSSHPQSIERRDISLTLVGRFPEREEYVISTSEFQRVKAHLLRLSNVKAGVTSDLDEGEPGKPTLKRRQPEPDSDSTTPGDSSSSDSKDAPPKLKKRGEEPEPKPSPSPEK
ncbi:MAG: M48 family metallopeptidase [Acidobacteriota bacterium]|nr:M48 family metallopeptidase [Acidobacteriota bacterium]